MTRSQNFRNNYKVQSESNSGFDLKKWKMEHRKGGGKVPERKVNHNNLKESLENIGKEPGE